MITVSRLNNLLLASMVKHPGEIPENLSLLHWCTGVQHLALATVADLLAVKIEHLMTMQFNNDSCLEAEHLAA